METEKVSDNKEIEEAPDVEETGEVKDSPPDEKKERVKERTGVFLVFWVEEAIRLKT